MSPDPWALPRILSCHHPAALYPVGRSRQLGDTISTSVIKAQGLAAHGVPPMAQEMTQLIFMDIAAHYLARDPAGAQAPAGLLSIPIQVPEPHLTHQGSLLTAVMTASPKDATLLRLAGTSPYSSPEASPVCEGL